MFFSIVVGPRETSSTVSVKHEASSMIQLEHDAANIVKPAASSMLELESYSWTHACRGRCVIINNHHFSHLLTNQPDRDGTQVDAAAIENLFVSLGFDVMRFDDLSVNDMSIQLREGNHDYCTFYRSL